MNQASRGLLFRVSGHFDASPSVSVFICVYLWFKNLKKCGLSPPTLTFVRTTKKTAQSQGGFKIYIALKYEQPELLMSDELIEKSRKPINKMLELSAKFGL